MRFFILSTFLLVASHAFAQDNLLQEHKFKMIHSDTAYVQQIQKQVELGITEIERFFQKPFKQKFTVRIFKQRLDLDKFWQVEWNAPDFSSQCWMVASGDPKGIAMLSPAAWDSEACEHNSRDLIAMEKLLTHELVHVFHYQYGPNASDETMEKIAWFVEGLATYASGQLDEQRTEQTRQLVKEGKVPDQLENFWTGKARYGQSGLLVQWIHKRYGSKILHDLLSASTEEQILTKLKLSEQQLIEQWKKSLL